MSSMSKYGDFHTQKFCFFGLPPLGISVVNRRGKDVFTMTLPAKHLPRDLWEEMVPVPSPRLHSGCPRRTPVTLNGLCSSSRSLLSCWLLSSPGPFPSRCLGSPPGFQRTLSPGDAHIHGRPRGPCQSAPKADVAKQIIFKRCRDIITKLQDKGNQKRRIVRR